MSPDASLYDLVERTALERSIPRLALWQAVADAIVAGELRVQYPPLTPGHAGPWLSWMMGFRAAVARYNDPNGMARILSQIGVSRPGFRRWVSAVSKPKHGPRSGNSGFQIADEKALAKIAALLEKGTVRSPYGAAMHLAIRGELAGGGSVESKAKRVSARYRDRVRTLKR